MKNRILHITLFLCLLGFSGLAQQEANQRPLEDSYIAAHQMAYAGNHAAARSVLEKLLSLKPHDTEARSLLARTQSWDGDYEEARKHFNKVTSVERTKKEVWLAAVKNELYAQNDAIALGLANKALIHVPQDRDLEFLRERALKNIGERKVLRKATGQKKEVAKAPADAATNKTAKEKVERKVLSKNTVGINNSFIVYDKVYEPMVFSSIDYKRQTKIGSIIPRINYSNRFNISGIQYDLDLYPKFSKTFYAYLNYGYSQASIFPNHKAGGDLYANLPGAMEASAGMRYLSFDSRNISIITNSVGLYNGNYYFSLRSYITPKSDNLTRVSGNLLVRKYLKDAENYMGITAGMGISPELRQLTIDGTLLSETLLYLESQRVNLEYQFTGKNTPNIYKTRLGLARQELVSSPGSFFWSLLAGFTYRVKF